MSNFKSILLLAAAALWLCSCKPSAKSFSYSYNVDARFFGETMALAGLDTKANLVKVYRAELVERLVERDAVPDYRLINSKSEQEYARLADTKNKSYLYLFQLFPESGTDTVVVYMATGYSPAGICTSVGPVYLGFQRRDRVQFKDVLKIYRVKNNDPASGDTTVNGIVVKRYGINKRKETTHIIFFNDQRFPAPGDSTNAIRITQIIRNVPNKIGGNKAVIFSTDKVLEDPNALVFSYYTTIHIK